MKITKTKNNIQDTTKTYSCPMHTEVTADKPGKCPKCGMNLVEKKEWKFYSQPMVKNRAKQQLMKLPTDHFLPKPKSAFVLFMKEYH